MDIEQTHQLLQLILNSVLMVAASILLLTGLLRRQVVVNSQLRQAQQAYEYFDWLCQLEVFRDDVHSATIRQRLGHFKRQLRWLKQHYRSTHYSVLAVHYALLLLVSSTLLIALRTVIAVDSLIPTALVLFVAGTGIQLLAIGLTLYDLHHSSRSLWAELRRVLGSDEQLGDVQSGRSRRPAQLLHKSKAARSTKPKVS